MTLSPNGRFKLLDAPFALPGKCAVCGFAASGEDQTDRRQYLDFGLDIDYYGVVYICTTCLNEVAVGMGYALPEVVDSIREESEQVKADLIRLNTAVEAINGVAAVLADGGWITSSGNLSGTVVGTEDSDQIIDSAVSDEGSDDPESDESDSESGSDDLRDALGL